MGVNKRLRDLENRSGGGQVIAVNWGDGFVTVNGERVTIEEFERRYPNHKVITWDDLDGDEPDRIPEYY